MNSTSKPFRKVGVIDLALFLLIMINHQFDQVIVVEVGVISKVLKDVLNCDVPIIVPIQVQESLPNMVIAVTKLLLQLGFQLKESALYNFFLLRWFQLLGISYLAGFEILLIVLWILHQVQMREERLLKSIKVDPRLLIIENIVLFDIGLDLLTVEGNPVLDNNAVQELFL